MTEIAKRYPSRLLLVSLSVVAAVLVLAAVEFASRLVLSLRKPTTEEIEAAARALKGDSVALTLKGLELARTRPEIVAKLNPVPLVPDADLLWRNQPLAKRTLPINPRPHGTNDTWTLSNDGYGFREPEPDLTGKPAGTFRILCVGDSITFGFNVDQEAAYPSQLAAFLRRRYPGKRFETVNAGVPGWSWRQGLRFLESEGLALDPDVVVIGHGTNDQFFPVVTTDVERLGRSYSWPRSIWRNTLAAVARTGTATLLARISPWSNQAPEVSPGCQEQLRQHGSCRRVSLPEIEQVVDEISALTDEKGIGLIILNADFVRTRAGEASRSAAQRHGVPFLDMVTRFDELRAADEADRAARLGLSPASRAAPANESEPRDVVLRVAVPAPGNVSVKEMASLAGSFSFDQPMLDDGTQGDEAPGDGVWSTTLRVPPNVPVLVYQYLLNGAQELIPLPPLPSTFGARTLRVDGTTRGPIDRFGELFLMAEQTHPNGAGQRRMAEEIAGALPSLPGFARFVAEATRAPASDRGAP